MNYEHREPTQDECLLMMADLLRIPFNVAVTVRDCVRHAYDEARDADDSLGSLYGIDDRNPNEAASKAAKARFAEFVDAQRPRWKEEAEAGLELIRSLSAKKELATA